MAPKKHTKVDPRLWSKHRQDKELSFTARAFHEGEKRYVTRQQQVRFQGARQHYRGMGQNLVESSNRSFLDHMRYLRDKKLEKEGLNPAYMSSGQRRAEARTSYANHQKFLKTNGTQVRGSYHSGLRKQPAVETFVPNKKRKANEYSDKWTKAQLADKFNRFNQRLDRERESRERRGQVYDSKIAKYKSDRLDRSANKISSWMKERTQSRRVARRREEHAAALREFERKDAVSTIGDFRKKLVARRKWKATASGLKDAERQRIAAEDAIAVAELDRVERMHREEDAPTPVVNRNWQNRARRRGHRVTPRRNGSFADNFRPHGFVSPPGRGSARRSRRNTPGGGIFGNARVGSRWVGDREVHGRHFGPELDYYPNRRYQPSKIKDRLNVLHSDHQKKTSTVWSRSTPEEKFEGMLNMAKWGVQLGDGYVRGNQSYRRWDAQFGAGGKYPARTQAEIDALGHMQGQGQGIPQGAGVPHFDPASNHHGW